MPSLCDILLAKQEIQRGMLTFCDHMCLSACILETMNAWTYNILFHFLAFIGPARRM